MAQKSSLSSRAAGARYAADEPEPEPQPNTLEFGNRAAKRLAKLKCPDCGADLRIGTAMKKVAAGTEMRKTVLTDKEYN